MLGWIMPAPFAMPVSVTGADTPGSCTLRDTNLCCRMHVVRIKRQCAAASEARVAVRHIPTRLPTEVRHVHSTGEGCMRSLVGIARPCCTARP